jgi:Ser/Thr protein kinase RdoA (MazF antagonist)
LEGGFISPKHVEAFKKVGNSIVDSSAGLFHDIELIRLHGDCHRGNLLHRPGEGIMVIDFDDMMMGPPVHDLWLLLPEYADKCTKEIGLILEGYETFRDFDRKTLKLIEPLRAMRIIYFLAWCSRQKNDYKFKNNFPEWGSDGFWQQEINDLNRQMQRIKEQID